MSSVMFLSIFLGLGVFYLILGIVVSKRINNVTDYFLAGRDLGVAALTFTLVATQIGGGMLLGSADAAYTEGYLGVFYSIGMAIGFLLLGFGLGSKLRAFNVATTAELFRTKYDSPFLRKTASLISALSMIGIFAGQVVATRALFNVLGIGTQSILLLFWAFVIIYTIMGGLKAVVATDIFQVIFLVTIVSSIFVYSMFNETSSLGSLTAVLDNQSRFSSFWDAFHKQLPILFTSAIYPLFGQDLAQRFFSARTKSVARVSALLAAVIIIVFSFVPVYFGMKAKFLGLALPAETSAFYSSIKFLVNDVVLALVGCALIAAITSTADSLLCAISSNITQDFDYSIFAGGELSVRAKLWLSKVVTCLAGVLGIGIAYYSTNILSLLSQSYGLLISCLFVPIFFCFFKIALKKEAAVLSVLAGAISFGLLKIAVWQGVCAFSPLSQVFLPLGISLIGYGLGYLFGSDTPSGGFNPQTRSTT